MVNAAGRIVVPGLIDVHTHYAREAEGPRICLEDGVTAWVDAGSAGADAIAAQGGRGARGAAAGTVAGQHRAAGHPAPAATRWTSTWPTSGRRGRPSRRHRDYVVGVKARLSRNVAADDVEVLRRTQAAASAFDLPVMIHMGQTVSPLSTLFALLKPGDVVTHMYAPPPNAIVGDDGRIRPAVLEARRRGVPLRRGQRPPGPHPLGHVRSDHADRFPARHHLHRRQHDQPQRGRG